MNSAVQLLPLPLSYKDSVDKSNTTSEYTDGERQQRIWNEDMKQYQTVSQTVSAPLKGKKHKIGLMIHPPPWVGRERIVSTDENEETFEYGKRVKGADGNDPGPRAGRRSAATDQLGATPTPYRPTHLVLVVLAATACKHQDRLPLQTPRLCDHLNAGAVLGIQRVPGHSRAEAGPYRDCSRTVGAALRLGLEARQESSGDIEPGVASQYLRLKPGGKSFTFVPMISVSVARASRYPSGHRHVHPGPLSGSSLPPGLAALHRPPAPAATPVPHGRPPPRRDGVTVECRHQAEVVEQCSHIKQFQIEADAARHAVGGRPHIGAERMVEERG